MSLVWVNSSTLSVSLTRKDWSTASILYCPMTSPDCSQIWSERNDWRWNGLTPIYSDPSPSSSIMIKPVRDGVMGLFSHIAMVSFDSEQGKPFVTALSLGAFSVSRIIGWDLDRQIM